MASDTNISWCDKTWNPTIGCSKVSPGCAHCYAEQLSMSPKMQRFGYTGLPWTLENAEKNVQTKEERLEQPLHWPKPQRVFVNSMSDLYHELVPFEFIDKVFAIMALADQHIFQILTKRPERMMEYVNTPGRQGRIIVAAQKLIWASPKLGNMDITLDWPLPNVWLGTSVENQHWADIRIPLLLQTPAAIRFLSCEPLLGPVDLYGYLPVKNWLYTHEFWRIGNGIPESVPRKPIIEQEGVDWVIVGGESGPNYRPMDLQWARDIRDQCEEASVAYWFKQGNSYRSEQHKELDGVRYENFPEVIGAAR